MAHILLVEDEDHLAKGIKFNLEAEGYEVTVSADGPTALDYVTAPDSPFDLIILDLMLPGMSGYKVCEGLREQGFGTPVLMLSARTLSEDRTRGFDVGADQYMSKPFELDELISRVRGLLLRHQQRDTRSAPVQNNIEIRINGRCINFETYEVSYESETTSLTPLEIKLIRHFIENEGRVVTRYELMEEVWEQPGSLQTRAPDQFMRRLRKIFEDDPAKPRYFLTIRDAGYRFVSSPTEK